MDRACLWCGQSLKGKRSDALYCDSDCRSAARHAEPDGQLRLQAHGGACGPLTAAAARGGTEPRKPASTAP